MSRVFSLSGNSADDNPWRRLPWTLPAALLIWAVTLSGAYFMEKPVHQPEELLPIDARLIEQSVERPAAVRKAKPLPVKPQKAPVMPQASPRVQNTAAAPAVTLPAAAPGGVQPKTGEGEPSYAGNTSENSGARAGAYDEKGTARGKMYANSGARAIIRPMPQIPDDLREGEFDFVASARFHISADGSATVELAKPTPNPRLNQVLLNSLRNWRFIPAIKNGKPIASTEEINVRLEVK